MDHDGSSQLRRSRRCAASGDASIELSGISLPVRLRNLSVDGALIEGEHLPVEGTELIFRLPKLNVAARVVWVQGGQAGLAFADTLAMHQLLPHMPSARPRVHADFRPNRISGRAISSGLPAR